MVKEMHYQENRLFYLNPKIKVTQNFAQYPRLNQQNWMLLHPIVKEKMHFQENTFDLDLGIKVTQNVAQYP